MRKCKTVIKLLRIRVILWSFLFIKNSPKSYEDLVSSEQTSSLNGQSGPYSTPTSRVLNFCLCRRVRYSAPKGISSSY